MKFEYLYRGVSVLDDQKNDGKIIPKGYRSSIEGQCGEIWMQCGEGAKCGSSDGNAVIAHQFDSDSAKTAYISTTTSIDVATRFATSGNLEDGYVYTLDVSKFEQFGVIAYEREIGSVGDEQEITLRTLDLGPIPDSVIINKKLVGPA